MTMWWRRPRTDEDFSAETRAHIDLEADRLIAEGLQPEEARIEARRAFGNLTRTQERFYESRRQMWWDDLRRDLRFAGRTLARNPGFSAVAVLTLALGIGATVAIFTVVNAVLLRPLPYPDADRVIAIRHHAPGLTQAELQSSTGLIAYYRDSAQMLTRLAGFETQDRNLTGSGRPERVHTLAATPELFDVLVRPELGRPFYESDAQQGAALVTIVTHAFWQSRFGGDPGIVGQRVELDGQQVEIVGVMPPKFVFPDPETRLLVPLWLNPKGIFGDFGTSTLARLAPGITLEAARQEMDALQHRISERFKIPQKLLDGWGWSVTVEPLRDSVVGDMSKPLWILFGSVGLVLLIAGANVANLFLVLVESRRRELAVRSALGASRARIARAFLAESFLLVLAGGTAGLLMASAGIRLLVAHGPAALPRLHEVSVDGTVVSFTAALSLLAGVVLGALPMVRLPRQAFATLPLDAGRGSTPGRERHRVRQLLIVGQVSMALVLLVGCGLMLQSIARLYAVDPGMKIEGLFTAGVSLGAQRDRARAVTFYHRVLDEVAGLPGVASVGAANILPLEASAMDGSSIRIESRLRTESQILTARYKAVTAGYFETLGMPLLEGRAPVRADSELDRPVVWVNETFVRQFLGNRAIGERVHIEGRTLETVGVVGDVREFGLREDVQPTAYLPLVAVKGVALDVMYVVVRTTGAPASLALPVRAAVGRIDPSVPLTTVRMMEEIVASSLAQTSFTMTLLAVAAGVALVLGVIGLYGVTRYIVSQRTTEIGVRLALGAQPRDVRGMVLRQGLSVALVGVIVGLMAAYALTSVMGSLLFEVSARDPATFGATALMLMAVSAFATSLSAHRATQVDPLVALRSE
jgi:putative ABC transport system permease protein